MNMYIFSKKLFKRHRKAKFETIKEFCTAMNNRGCSLSWSGVANWEKRGVVPSCEHYMVACDILGVKYADNFIIKKGKHDSTTKGRESKSTD